MQIKLIKNIFSSIISLLIISLLVFFLSKMVPGDSVLSLLDINSDSQYSLDFKAEYERKALALNLNKPLFYFSVLPSNFPKNLNETILFSQRRWEKKLLFEGYNYNAIQRLWNEAALVASQTEDTDLKLKIRNQFLNYQNKNISEEIAAFISQMTTQNRELTSLKEAWVALEKNKKSSFFPNIHFYGLDNQYHRWISNFMVGNLGESLLDQKSVSSKIGRALVYTLFLVLFSLCLSYLLGILLGLLLSYIKSKRLLRMIESFLFGFYSIPIFWLATLLLVFFTTREYGTWTNIFPSVGLVPIDTGEAWYLKIINYGKQLILPVFCLVIHNLAFIASLTKRNLVASQKMGHIMTSRAYGYTEKDILLKDVFPHTLLPLITSISASIPSALGGSLIIEIIFNIPGMGRLMYNGILNYDWPVVFSITMFIAIITIISYLIADVLYRVVDPRIKDKS